MRGTTLKLSALVLASLVTPAMWSQSKPQRKLIDATSYDFAAGYQNIRANAPPGGCQCFDLNGGFVSGSYHLNDWLRIAGEFTGGHGSHISPLGQNLTLMTFTGGPQISHRFGPFRPYGEVLVGGARGSDSYFPSKNASSTSATSFAYSAGGGLDVYLTPRFSIRAFDAQYLRTSFPNGTNNEQNQLMIGAGIVIKFYGHAKKSPPPAPLPTQEAPPPPPPPAPVVNLTCSTNVANVPLGEMVVITADAKTQPESLDLTYAWTATGGTVEGSGKVVSIDTATMEVGDYQVKGHAALASDASVGADCVAVFRVVKPVQPATSTTVVDIEQTEKDFHEHVKDAYFALNSAKITPATLATIIQAAQYLVAHPKIKVLLSGWTDPRGSIDYNMALGIRRANAVRDALIDAGVPPSQLEVLSNGKSSQVCVAKDQKCWQMNRRVSYDLKP
jgi:outer membrane protein OmpA-like peptidoglycan-associated protein/opacity protein-like surface antigen